MKTKQLHLSSGIVRISSLLLLMAVFAGCTGPMGPKGNDGVDGINYTHSVIYDITPAEWSGNTDGYNVSLNVPEITDNIYYTGEIIT